MKTDIKRRIFSLLCVLALACTITVITSSGQSKKKLAATELNGMLNGGMSVKDMQSRLDEIKNKNLDDELVNALISKVEANIEAINGVSLNMVTIEGGTFTMGSPSSEADHVDDETQHQVTLSSFQMGKYEVTQKLWRAVMGNNPSDFQGCDDCPVETVSWDDVQTFIDKLNSMTGKRFRLPTEAEWEYAARGGNKSNGNKWAGSGSVDGVGWYMENSGLNPHPVGQKQANEQGLYDMSGNVWEWCQDWYGDYSSSSQINPQGPNIGKIRVRRGGSWFGDAANARVAYRYYDTPAYRVRSIGFRLCSSL